MDRRDLSAREKKRFRELAERDVLEETSEEENALLRQDENLGPWREALVSLQDELDQSLRERKKQRRRVMDRYQKESTDQALAAAEQEREDHRLFRASASAYKADLDEKLTENKALRQKRHYRLNESRDPRELLRRSRDLISERASTEGITEEERELLEDIERLLEEREGGG